MIISMPPGPKGGHCKQDKKHCFVARRLKSRNSESITIGQGVPASGGLSKTPSNSSLGGGGRWGEAVDEGNHWDGC